MKIEIQENKKLRETEVVIYCRERNESVLQLYRYIKRGCATLPVFKAEEQLSLPLSQILYLESVDGRTFAYTDTETFTVRESLRVTEQTLRLSPFVRVSKSCLINITFLKSVASYQNHRLLATLTNGEKILVGRTYITDLRNKIKKGI